MSGKLLRLVCIAATAAGTALVPVLAPVQAAAVPEPDKEQRKVADLLTDLQGLYRKAEEATEAYNATEEKLTKQRAETDRLDRALARARLSLHDSRGEAGRLARQQYQSSTDLSPYVHLLLARDPQHAIDQGHVIGRLAQERAGTITRLTGNEHKAHELARKARGALDRQLALTERRRKERDEVRTRLHDVEKLLASLSREQLTTLAELERKGIEKAQSEFIASGALGSEDSPGDMDDGGSGDSSENGENGENGNSSENGDGSENGKNRGSRWSGNTGRAPSAEGRRAVRYAVRQLGKPYEWGAEGPRTYDCSGLTSQAWAEAGTPVPRTSQEQWKQLERIPLDRLRPGDLVVYFTKATHVALYLGDGMVVHAPRPGAKVKASPIAANPVLGAVRPDPAGEPLRRYEPPELPEGATDGSDEGYDGYAAPAPDTSAR
ncbi:MULTISPECIES: C40 family peptidase [Streptomyces]|uniref:C40 family peptidase n=1 Tax=Streptomyces TaxID=1883 RepID=UPI000CF20194|nr:MULTISPECIES: C40 family peptidase [Streptomyces]PPS68659.1 hypothetical protein BV882_31320 [Streptomyces sp. 46]